MNHDYIIRDSLDHSGQYAGERLSACPYCVYTRNHSILMHRACVENAEPVDDEGRALKAIDEAMARNPDDPLHPDADPTGD